MLYFRDSQSTYLGAIIHLLRMDIPKCVLLRRGFSLQVWLPQLFHMSDGYVWNPNAVKTSALTSFPFQSTSKIKYFQVFVCRQPMMFHDELLNHLTISLWRFKRIPRWWWKLSTSPKNLQKAKMTMENIYQTSTSPIPVGRIDIRRPRLDPFPSHPDDCMTFTAWKADFKW